VTHEYDSLWVNYDGFRVRVGAGEDVTTEQELFDEIDIWVAHDRPGGPGRWLPRDAAAVEEAYTAARRCVPWFEGAVARLAADLQNAWGKTTTWEVTLAPDDLPWPGFEGLPFPPLDHGLMGLWETVVSVQPATDPAPPADVDGRVGYPEIRIMMTSADGSGTGHTAPFWEPTSEEDAIDELASLFEDALIEEVWGYWPTCPAHDYELEITRIDGKASWVCSEAGQVLGPVGSLTSDPHALQD
jgi:hypothetical protein